MPGRCPKNAVRAGFSLLELQVAFVIFGIALAGLGPLVVMQSRQLQELESRFDDQTTYYLVPSTDAWARKLGAAASIATEDPGPAASVVTLIDDGDQGYSNTGGNWYQWSSGHPFQGDYRENENGAGSDKATWEFAGLEAGWYEVLVTWGGDGWATDAPYTVLDGETALATVRVNQKNDPSGAAFEGSPWESLGVFSIASGALRVDLSDDADEWVVADAVRIVPAGNKVEVVSLERSLTGEDVTAHVSVTVQVP
ncbi:MAG: golvesin C-terminal-like domain-containing protein [Planctomycetota bacterium]|jgi:type II secretory pathway pseudopilin PulG